MKAYHAATLEHETLTEKTATRRCTPAARKPESPTAEQYGCLDQSQFSLYRPRLSRVYNLSKMMLKGSMSLGKEMGMDPCHQGLHYDSLPTMSLLASEYLACELSRQNFDPVESKLVVKRARRDFLLQ